MKLRIILPVFAVLACLTVASAQAQPTNAISPEDSIVLPPRFHDPIEPFNRAMWGFDKFFANDLVRPFGRGYRHVVPHPVRTGIGNIGKIIVFPRRLLNDFLQGKWSAANDETERFFVNTLFGLGGFFDLASQWDIPDYNANFGQTFRQWGWHPGIYLALPIFGPSDVRDGSGLACDAASNPMFYFFPYEYISPGITANNLSDTVEKTTCFINGEADSYSLVKYGWSFERALRKPDMHLTGDQDQATLETLQSAFFSYTNPEFPAWGKTRSVLIPGTGKKLDFTFYLQPGPAPVVYLVPGFGASRFSGNEMGLAELLYKNGYSAVTISSTFHPEFMENAATTDLPSYPPTDASDIHAALTQIDHYLEAKYPHRLGSRAIMGYSMGAFQSLLLAARPTNSEAPLIKFDRFVAIDSPVNLRHAVTNLDSFYRGPLAWPAAERTADIENIFLKAAFLVENPPKPGTVLPFNAVESKFLIALALRLTLRDVIFDSQLRHNQGVVKTPLKKSRREPAYDEILQFSFWDYVTKFAVPYDRTKGADMEDAVVARQATTLLPYTAELQANPNIRVISNRNDFLEDADDIAWLESTFPADRRTLFDHGGHLGNLGDPTVQHTILAALDGLGAAPKIK